MKAILQRVTGASVSVAGDELSRIGRGWLVLLGVAVGDGSADAAYIADKIMGLRCFTDSDGKMNLSVKDIGGELLVISQFTLYGDCRKGRRPSFSAAARPAEAEALYEEVITRLEASGLTIGRGRFGADMQVELINDGPVTLIVDSPSAS